MYYRLSRYLADWQQFCHEHYGHLFNEIYSSKWGNECYRFIVIPFGGNNIAAFSTLQSTDLRPCFKSFSAIFVQFLNIGVLPVPVKYTALFLTHQKELEEWRSYRQKFWNSYKLLHKLLATWEDIPRSPKTFSLLLT